jgi:hypothetical protein
MLKSLRWAACIRIGQEGVRVRHVIVVTGMLGFFAIFTLFPAAVGSLLSFSAEECEERHAELVELRTWVEPELAGLTASPLKLVEAVCESGDRNHLESPLAAISSDTARASLVHRGWQVLNADEWGDNEFERRIDGKLIHVWITDPPREDASLGVTVDHGWRDDWTWLLD